MSTVLPRHVDHGHGHSHNNHHHGHSHSHSHSEAYDLESKDKSAGFRPLSTAKSWLRSIFQTEETRSIFMFLIVNFAFAFVELAYGLITNSLGLISDSFHMFFDCSALVVGLVAALIARKSANERYTYGYQRAEILGGFVNALFLLFIAVFVFKEALERFLDPPDIHTHRLVAVAVAGLLVNLVGLFFFQHGHTHSHGHDHHGHSHHGHDDGQKRNFVMDGVILHVMADTLGSIGVIVSSILIHLYQWMIADAICSLFIAVLIFTSTIPLLKTSLSILMQRTPASLESNIFRCYRQITAIDGVISYREPHFWTLAGGNYVGSIIIVMKSDANDTSVRTTVQSIFRDIGVNQMVVQTERF